jgi:hypothetical protein
MDIALLSIATDSLIAFLLLNGGVLLAEIFIEYLDEGGNLNTYAN